MATGASFVPRFVEYGQAVSTIPRPLGSGGEQPAVVSASSCRPSGRSCELERNCPHFATGSFTLAEIVVLIVYLLLNWVSWRHLLPGPNPSTGRLLTTAILCRKKSGNTVLASAI
ncbi:hypothetical protein KIN20_031778 [Parelaphostrongylus tenuis]|uniref:Uncharacterized protein n=1 Tax=Parelaphostrongylus tenuis TaxID=148309 RepID=A0AAD5R637_PARTN|nr:hypothetical protein KIN20_031778 [Parelaphostrongylus tenuis]